MNIGRSSFVVAAGIVLFVGGFVRAEGLVRQLTSEPTTVAAPGALDDAGTFVYTGSSADLLGTNPGHAFQIWRFAAATGAPAQVTNDPRGVAAVVSVSDDGTWLAFASPADPLGTNPDRSLELFVMRSDGTEIAQLTSDPAPNAGSVGSVVLSGDGSRVVFTANTDPLGTNPSNRTELFVIDRTGANLRQLTQTVSGAPGSVGIGDDGTRIVFAHSGDLLGTNADLGGEIYAILADGTGLRQLTDTPEPYDASAPSFAGNGSRIAFQSNADPFGTNPNHWTEIFAIDWAGTGLRQVTRTTTVLGITGDPTSQAPSITDDGQTIVYFSNQSAIFPPVNLDGNFEVFKIRFDGTNRVALTSSALDAGSVLPIVAGGGGRIAYYDVGTTIEFRAMDGSGGGKVTLAPFDLKFLAEPDVSPDGARAVFTRSTGLFGGAQVWKVETDGTGYSQVTTLASGSASAPTVADGGQTIVFAADSDPTGGNSDLSSEIFSIAADGSGVMQLTSAASGSSANPVAAQGGTKVVFDSDADLTGGNADASREIFVVDRSGLAVVQLTNGPAGTTSRNPRIDDAGSWVVFESNADLDGGNPDGSYEIWRVRTDATGLQRITGDPVVGASSPDIAADGSLISFSTSADPLGTNPEGNAEVFVFEPAISALRQLTEFATGSSGGARMSRDGAWVVFSSNAPVFETDPDDPTDLYRVPSAGGAVERIGGLRVGALGGVGTLLGGGGGAAAADTTGDLSVFSGIDDFTLGNPDGLSEVWAIDREGVPMFAVGKDSPTILRWSVESGPVRYDAIRGDVANLRFLGSEVDLGPVVCLENDSPDTDTVGFGDSEEPLPGQVFFFLYRGSQGLSAGPGSYGTSRDGRERVAGTDCQGTFRF
jgi:Tol biopolymer transport system component